MAVTNSIFSIPLLSCLLLLLASQFSIAFPCIRAGLACKAFQFDISAINSTSESVSFSVSSSLTLLDISYIVNNDTCLTRSGECYNISEQYYSNGQQDLTNVYHISCTIKKAVTVSSIKLDFRNCSYSFGLQNEGGEMLPLCIVMDDEL